MTKTKKQKVRLKWCRFAKRKIAERLLHLKRDNGINKDVDFAFFGQKRKTDAARGMSKRERCEKAELLFKRGTKSTYLRNANAHRAINEDDGTLIYTPTASRGATSTHHIAAKVAFLNTGLPYAHLCGHVFDAMLPKVRGEERAAKRLELNRLKFDGFNH